MDASLDHWIERQRRVAADEILACVSATDIVKTRPAFGRRLQPAPGSVVASPSLANWDPDPDYFFHWFRDSAIVMDALRRLWRDGLVGARALVDLADFVRFSAACSRIDGRTSAAGAERRASTAPDHLQFLRSAEELDGVHGLAAMADTRVDPDGTIDTLTWGRPQFDGPALRALALLRWRRTAGDAIDAALATDLDALVRSDLAFAFAVRDAPCLDLWEEESGHHYYTRRILAAALREGGRWLNGGGDAEAGRAYEAAAADILTSLDAYWSETDGFFRSHGEQAAHHKDPDISVILATLHAGDAGERHGLRDPRIASTLSRLESLFAAALNINRDRPDAPALGRYVGDVYFRGGAWYVSTFAAAEFYARTGALQRADGFLETARAFTPADGLLSEQIDRDSGEQISAKRLAWSYAAFVSCAAARRARV